MIEPIKWLLLIFLRLVDKGSAHGSLRTWHLLYDQAVYSMHCSKDIKSSVTKHVVFYIKLCKITTFSYWYIVQMSKLKVIVKKENSLMIIYFTTNFGTNKQSFQCFVVCERVNYLLGAHLTYAAYVQCF